MMTLTISHNQSDRLIDLKDKISDMKSELMRHKKIKNLDLVFKHSTLEIVYAKNGWHVHYHVILCRNGNITNSEIDDLRNQWVKIGKNRDVSVDFEKGLNITFAGNDIEKAAAYITKNEDLVAHTKKLANETISDLKNYRKKETYSIQQLMRLAALNRWDEICYSRKKVESILIEYLTMKNVNYFRGCKKWNQLVKLTKDDELEEDKTKEKESVKKYIHISAVAFVELMKYDLLLGSERKDRMGNIIEYDGIFKEHRRNKDINDTWGYVQWIVECMGKVLSKAAISGILLIEVENESEKIIDSFGEDFQLNLFESQKLKAA